MATMKSPTFVGYKTMVRKELVRIFRIWSQTLLPPVITMSLYFVVFGGFIGSQLAPIAGYSYMQYIVPGLVMMTIITSSYMNTVSTFYFAKWQHTIDEILVSPMPSWVVIAGYVTGGVLRAFLTGFLVVIVSLLFTHLVISNIFILFAAAFLTSILFALAGIVNAIYAKSFDAISIVPNFVLTPLTYLGGVFYSISLLPPLFRHISLANPILYMVNAFRYGFLGVSDVSMVHCFAVMGGFTLVMLIWVLVLFKKGAGLKK
ncbi:MAG: Transport permease protein [Parcubacteria group bacterium]|nr:Transport permease protein [Parcubacteria group bacterium]